jgi:hypothetical protein
MILVEKEVLVERLADCERTDTDRALGLQQMALRIRRWRAAIPSIRMLGEKSATRALLSEQGESAVPAARFR